MEEKNKFMKIREFRNWQYEHSDTIFKYRPDNQEEKRNEELWNYIFNNPSFEDYAALLAYRANLYMISAVYPEKYPILVDNLNKAVKLEETIDTRLLANHRINLIKANKKYIDARKFLVLCLASSKEKGFGYLKKPFTKMVKHAFKNDEIDKVVVPIV